MREPKFKIGQTIHMEGRPEVEITIAHWEWSDMLRDIVYYEDTDFYSPFICESDAALSDPDEEPIIEIYKKVIALREVRN